MQDACKVQFDGYEEPLKVALNRATINALVDAFGRSSKDWQAIRWRGDGQASRQEVSALPRSGWV